MPETQALREHPVVGLVPARGGSKGIKNKNIVDIAGQPLISYVIEALQESDSVDIIICTTDSEEIAEVAREYGAEVPFLRPTHMAEDDSPIYTALAHAAKKTEELLDFSAEYVVTAQPTYPLLKPNQVDEVVKKAIEEGADSAITAVELDHDAHPYNIRRQDTDGHVGFWKEDKHYKYPNRQQKPDFYQFGNVFVTDYDLLSNEEKLEGEENYLVEIDHKSALDINNPEDIDLVEFFLKQ